jgi:AcrR family transcriptional regulator
MEPAHAGRVAAAEPGGGPEMTVGETRERIIDAAISLFNERGTCAVSTNHVAKAADMSPGNLYYHFRNKEEIIRAAFERSAAEEAVVWASAADAGSREAMQSFLGAVLTVRARYPFLRIEMPELVSRDSELARSYHEVQAGRLDTYRELLEYWLDDSVRYLTAEEIQRVADVTWLVLGAWYAHLVAGGEPVDDDSLARGALLVTGVVDQARILAQPRLATEDAEEAERARKTRKAEQPNKPVKPRKGKKAKKGKKGKRGKRAKKK